jgi:hypothetical protein
MNPNLSRRPAKPALGNGRVQRGIRRALWVLGTASTTEIMEWTHSRIRGRRCDANRAARHALYQLAIRVGRAKTIGRPWLWVAKAVADREITQ